MSSKSNEVDNIVLYQLTHNVGLALPANVKSIADFDAQTFFAACSACVKLIDSGAEVVATLPSSKGRAFQACTDLMNAIKTAGFNGEMDFNNFMYVAPERMKAILSWLVSNVPTAEAAEPTATVTKGATTLRQKAERLVQRQAEATWIFQKKLKKNVLRRIEEDEAEKERLNSLTRLSSKQLSIFHEPQTAEQQAVAQKVPLPTQQVLNLTEYAPSLFEFNASELAREKHLNEEWLNEGVHSGKTRGAWLKQRKNLFASALQQALAEAAATPLAVSDVSVAAGDGADAAREARRAAKKAREAEELMLKEAAERSEKLAARETQLREEITSVGKQLRKIQREINDKTAEAAQLAEESEKFKTQAEEAAKASEELEAVYNTQKKTADMAGDVEGNRKRLQAEGKEHEKEIEEISKQFEEKAARYRATVEEKQREMEAAKSRYSELNEETKACRQRRKDLAQEAQAKEELRTQLEADLAKSNKGIDRNMFVTRIMDIIKNIKKQQNEITKINLDNKELQKEINQFNEAVSRSFIATEEKIYKDATKDDVAKRVYRQLVLLREAFDNLIQTVESTGALKQQQHEVEEKTAKLVARDETLNKERLQRDLAEIRAANAQLEAELKASKKNRE